MLRLHSAARATLLAVCLTLLLSCEHIFDFKPPKVWFVTPSAGETVFSPVAVELRVDDEHFRSLDLYVDGNKTNTYQSDSISDSLVLSDGSHTLRVRAYDKGGNHSDATITVTARVLGLPTLLAPTNGSVLSETRPRFSWTYPYAVQEFQLQADNNSDFSSPAVDQSLTDSSFTPTTPLEQGGYYWRVRARVNATRWSSWSGEWSFAIVTQGAPPPSLYLPVNHDTTGDATPYFDWSDVGTATKYWLRVDDDVFFLSPEITDSSLTASEHTPAQNLPDGKYYWCVSTQNASGYWGGWSVVWDFTLSQVGVPTLLQPPDSAVLTENRPEFKWSVVSGVEMYWLQVDDDHGFSSPTVNDSVAATTYTPASGLADGKYYWRVRAKSEASFWSGWTGARSFTVMTQGPPAPTLLQPTNGATLSDSLLDFDWSDVSGAVRYWLQVDDDTAFSSPTIVDSGLTVSDYTTQTALSDGIYYWRVSARNAGLWSNWAARWRFTINTVGIPVLREPADDTTMVNSRPTFLWDKLTRAISYQVQIATDSSFATPTVSDSTTDTTYVPAAPLADGRCFWRIRASRSPGAWGNWSSIWSVSIVTQPPNPPDLIQPANDSTLYTGLPDFDWTDVTGVARYHLQVDDDSSFSAPEILDSTLTVSSYSATTPLDYARYHWRVSASNLAGWGGWSAAWSFTVLTVGTPTLLAPADSELFWHTESVALSWTSVPGAAFYELQIDNEPGFGLPRIVDSVIPDTSHKWTPGTQRGRLYWRVRAGVNSIWGAWSSRRSFEAVPYRLGSYTSPGDEKDVSVAGSYAGLADDNGYFRLVDVSNPSNPAELGFCEVSSNAWSVALQDTFAFIGCEYLYFVVVSIAEPHSPQQVADLYMNFGPLTDVCVAGSRAYVTNSHWLSVINISDPAHPFEAGRTGLIYPVAVDVAGSTAYVAGDSRLYVFDVTDPSNPTQIRYLSLPDTGLAVHCMNSFVYVADNRNGLRIYDASDPHSPSLVGTYNTPGTARGVQACGRYVYVADGGGGLRVIDVSSPSSPREVGFFDSGDAQSVQVVGPYAYVANSPGLLIIKVKPE